MAYGSYVSKPYAAGGSPTDSLSAIDLGRTAVSGLTPVVQEVTHEITGNGSLIITVTTPGTRVRLNASSLLIRRATVVALPTNSSGVVVGDANVVAAIGTQGSPTMRGVPLNNPGIDTYDFEFNDLTNMWIDSLVAGDGVSVVYYT